MEVDALESQSEIAARLPPRNQTQFVQHRLALLQIAWLLYGTGIIHRAEFLTSCAVWDAF